MWNMMWNIMLDWMDFTGKSKLAKSLSKKLELNCCTSNQLKEIFWDDLVISNWKYILSELNKIDNTVFDRHFLSLLSYWKTNKKEEFKKIIDLEKALTDLLQDNPKSVFVLRWKAYNLVSKSIEKHKNKKWKHTLSEHDKRLMDETYFTTYLNNFLYFFWEMERINNDLPFRYRSFLLKQELTLKNYNYLYKQIIKAHNLLEIQTPFSVFINSVL